jgi:hypothetical protein
MTQKTIYDFDINETIRDISKVFRKELHSISELQRNDLIEVLGRYLSLAEEKAIVQERYRDTGIPRHLILKENPPKLMEINSRERLENLKKNPRMR